MGGMQVWGSHLSVMPRPREKNKARKGEGAGERAIGPVDECEGCKGLGGDKIMGRGGRVGAWGGKSLDSEGRFGWHIGPEG